MDVAHFFFPALILASLAGDPLVVSEARQCSAVGQASKPITTRGLPGVQVQGPRGGVQIGSPAPLLQVDQWIRGSEFQGFQRGQVYAVAFLSPWSELCNPSLTDLAHFQSEYGPTGLEVLGIGGSDSTGTTPDILRSCTEQFGGLIQFRVGFDAGERTRTAWVGEGHQEVLPRVVLIDQRGTVVFVGEPRWLAMPLSAVLRGDFQVEAVNAEVERAKRTLELLSRSLRRDPAGVLVGLDVFDAQFPEYKFCAGALRFVAMLDEAAARMGSLERAYAFGAAHVEAATARNDPSTLDKLAFAIIDPERDLEGRGFELDLDLAKRAAEQAERITGGQNAVVLDTLSRVHFAEGNLVAAVAIARRAHDVAPKILREQLRARLEAYQRLLNNSEQEAVSEHRRGRFKGCRGPECARERFPEYEGG